MEDAVTFDVWGVATSQDIDLATALLRRGRPALDSATILKSRVRSAAHKSSMLVGEDLGWADAEGLRRDAALAFVDVRTAQHRVSPYAPSAHHCTVHRLYYGGVLGCPVCRGWHA